MKFKLSFILIFIFSINGISGEIYSEYAIGSRAFGLGQISTYSFYDALSTINNPANLVNSEKRMTSFYYSEPNVDEKNIALGFSVPTYSYGTFGFSYYYFIMDDLPEINELGTDLGSYSFSQKEFIISYGNSIFNNILYGINSKWINDKFFNLITSDINTDNIGLDISIGWLPKFENVWLKYFDLGIIYKNIVQLNDRNDHIPREIRLIAENMYKIENHSLFLALNYSWYENVLKDYNTRLYAGIEYGYKNIFFRTGYNNNIFSLGVGIHYRFIVLDYGYGEYINNSFIDRSLHNLTLGFKF